MATVSVLKQYAEDRDIDMLGRALKAILKTPQQKKIMKQIRPFIPPRQRHRFDDFIKENEVLHNNHEDDVSPGGLRNGVKITAIVHREDGSFGFVLAGNNPVFIESVEPGGPADRAGLLAGDCIVNVNKIDVRYN
ncbi:rhophilin-1-like [Mytilus californianus]|uniref:rhophilin-1-like n=1 Tax=Mytilus californianus TaxID=6549 RepID=UPI0022483980|nr:rhophilin-1-like [Mytilus californianus]